MEKLTTREIDIIDFIKHFSIENGYSPTVRDIAKGLYFSGTFSVQRHLENLEKKRIISRVKGVSRSIKIIQNI